MAKAAVKLGGKFFTIGNSITFNEDAEGSVPGVYPGLSVIIHRINQSEGDGLVGLFSPDEKISGWADLDDTVPNRQGWWIHTSQLQKCIYETNDNGELEVKNKFEFKGEDLAGKSCRIIARLRHDKHTVFVEFEDHVNGCSADGLGKSGHCVAVNPNILIKKRRVKHAK